jgi:hypothetical protein
LGPQLLGHVPSRDGGNLNISESEEREAILFRVLYKYYDHNYKKAIIKY